MSNQVQFSTFSFHNLPVRVIVDTNQEFWFCGTDVCAILGYKNAPDALAKHCKKAGIAKRYISYPSGRKEAIFINEPNLYRLIIKSRMPEAEPFEAWVFEEVLPQIRKTGQYSTKPALPEPEPKINVEMTADELRRLINVWMLITRYEESVGILIRAVQSIVRGNLISLAQFNHSCVKPALLDTLPIIKKLTAKLPGDVQLHSSRSGNQ